MRKNYTPFFIVANEAGIDEKYVDTAAMVVFFDGFLVKWEGDDRIFLRLPDAIRWVEKQIAETSGTAKVNYEKMIANLIKFQNEIDWPETPCT